MRTFRDYLKEQLKDPAFAKAYAEEGVYVDLAVEIALLRQKSKLSQAELAKKLHTSQQMISRLEDPQNGSFSLKTLVKIARAFNKSLSVRFV